MQVKELKPAKYNPRKITQSQLDALGKSLIVFGDLSGIVYNQRTGNVVGGHQRLKCIPLDAIIEKINLSKISKTGTISEGNIIFNGEKYVYREVDWDESKEKAANIAANKHGGDFDDQLLTEVLCALREAEFDLNLTGFNQREVDKLLQFEGGITDDDQIPNISENSITGNGDLYSLGNHYLLCGDATKKEDVGRLMNGKKAGMIFTDPPYNVNYIGRGKKTNRKIENDDQTEKSFCVFLEKVFYNYKNILSQSGAMYCCYASKTHRQFEDSLNKSNFEIRNQIIWVKLLASLGWGDYQWKHEPIFYCHLKGNNLLFYGDRKQYTIWDEKKTDKELLKIIKSEIIRQEDGVSTVWRFGREHNYSHPTQKPIQLVEKAIFNSSERNDIVVDLFLGGGSTLIAAEKTGRICYGMEIDKYYCDVIVKRWEDYTGKKAILKNARKKT